MRIKFHPPISIYQKGRRAKNEDYIFPEHGKAQPNDQLFMVCDGMGGPPKGEVASELCCKTVAEFFQQKENPPAKAEVLEDALYQVYKALQNYAQQHPESERLGTTFTFLQNSPQGILLAWCGDSRIYHIRNGKILFQSKDHSYVQELIDEGEIFLEEALHHPMRNIISRAVTAQKAVKPDIQLVKEVQAGDHFLLCSDGVLEYYGDPLVLETLFHTQKEPDKIIEQMEQTCQKYCSDNFSAYLLTVREVEP
jgi:PPM family protein phosphatase